VPLKVEILIVYVAKKRWPSVKINSKKDAALQKLKNLMSKKIGFREFFLC